MGIVLSQLEPTPAHLTYLCLSGFLIAYTLFAKFIKNRLHLSEPPIALAVGVLLGPLCLGWLTPDYRGVLGPPKEEGKWAGGWGWGDDVTQETARVIVGIQVFAVGVELPKHYASKHWRSVLMLLGPVMTVGWLICAGLVVLIFNTDFPTALVVAACLTPTDPVLAASILSNSQFSDRVPKRIKDLLSAESGCNDGISFPFLFIGIAILQNRTVKGVITQWLGETVGWQCLFGTLIGLGIGWAANKILRFSEKRDLIDPAGFVVFYLLAAVLCVGIGSTLNTDDFLVAFGAGYGFARDGWFAEKTKGTRLPNIIDLLLNSTMFVYLGTIVPWYAFSPQPIVEWITPGRLILFIVLVLLLRRIPIVLLLYKWIPDILTFREALFCGHFGPIGLGGVFLAIEARAQLETGSSIPLKHPPPYEAPYTDRQTAIETVWPLVIAIVFASTMVHGLSVFVMSAYSHLTRPKNERAKFFAAETDPLDGMEHEDGYEESLLSEEFEPYSDER